MDANRTALIEALKRQYGESHLPRFVKKIKHPIRYYLPKIIARIGAVRHTQCRTFYGKEIGVYLPESVSTELYRNGFFEHDLSFSLITLLKAGDTFIDVGTHLGYFSLLASQMVGDRGNVFSFEPTPRTREALIDNTRHTDNITVVPFAAWDDNTQLDFNDFGWVRSAWNSLFAPRLTTPIEGTSIQVDAVRLDDFFAEKGLVPDFIKIDAESAESQVLKGLEKTLSTIRPSLSLEVGDFALEGVPTSRELIDRITSFGYDVFEVKDWKLCIHQPRETYEYDNLIFIHRDRQNAGTNPV